MTRGRTPIPIAERYETFSSEWKDLRRKPSKGTVHNFRIAARRLLAVLELAQSVESTPDIETLTQEVDKALRTAGRMRDAQVEKTLLKQIPANGAVKPFLRHLSKVESQQTKRIDGKLTGKKLKRIGEEIQNLTSLIEKALPLKDPGDIDAALEMTLHKNSGPLRKVERHFRYTSDKALHEIRIGLKKLRYMLEVVHPESEESAKLRNLQKEMGRVHDLTTLETRIGKWSKGRGPTKKAAAAELIRAIRSEKKQAIEVLNRHSPAAKTESPS